MSSIIDIYREVLGSMSRNKLRVALTGFSVAFGIFMLMVLMAAGNGLRNGIESNFRGQAKNTMNLWGGWTSMEWNGHQKYRNISLNLNHLKPVYEFYNDELSGVANIANRKVRINVGRTWREVNLRGVSVAYKDLEGLEIVAGRWINDFDAKEKRRVLTLDVKIMDALFPKRDYADCLGEWIRVDELKFQLVGCFRKANSFDSDNVYTHFSTMASLYPATVQQMWSVVLALRDKDSREAIEDFEKRFKESIARVEDFNPDDGSAVFVWNKADGYLEFMGRMDAMRLLIWIIAIASLMAGIVGIGNIMMITVKERTREFGIRKAIGARSRSIVAMVMTESVSITLLFGYIGMVAGVGLIQLVNGFMNEMPTEDGWKVFDKPTVDLDIAIAATAIMVLAGLVAGYIPTRKAMKIKPVEALAGI